MRIRACLCFLFLIFLLFAAVAARAQVVINEIMYTPDSPEPEWVELFNAGATPVTVGGWTIGDASSGRASLPAATLAAGAYVVVTRDSAALRSSRSVRGTVLEAPLPSFNNGGDAVVLYDAAGTVVDGVTYAAEWGGHDGRSLERRLFGMPSDDDSTWSTSIAGTGATPGRRNSISPRGFDVGIELAAFDGGSALAIVVVRNEGALATAAVSVGLYHDADDDGRADARELLDTRLVASMAIGDSQVIALAWTRPLTAAGEPGLIVATTASDEEPDNNEAEFTAYAPTGVGGVVINEIMFDPISLGTRPAAEYIELRNVTDAPISVAGWRIYDATLRSQGTLPQSAPPIAPRGYLLVASDTTIYFPFPRLRDSATIVTLRRSGFSLNGDEDEVSVRDRSGVVIDRVHYRSAWHRTEIGDTRGISLERVSPDAESNDGRNWSSSAAASGGTPGAVNSLETAASGSPASLTADPPIVSPDGDGHDDFVRLRYRLPASSGRILLTAYDLAGRPVRTIANNEPAASVGEVVFDGRDDDRRPLAPGIYLVRLAAYDDLGRRALTASATLIVARRL